MNPHEHYGDSDGERSALLEIADPDIYRKNPFRVLGLPVFANSKDIAKRQKLLKISQKLGNGAARTPNGCLPLDPPADAEQLRKASRRLHDPLARLIDEMFWLWPSNGDATDDALGSLQSGDINQATWLWMEHRDDKRDGAVARHNLAVLNHTLALDVDRVSQTSEVTADIAKWRDYYWTQAYECWSETIEEDSFWIRLRLRVRELDDPRVSGATVQLIRQYLEHALVSIGAQLAVRHAKAKRTADAERHLGYLRASDFDESVIEEAVVREAGPLVGHLKQICEREAQLGVETPETANEAALRMVRDTESLLASIDVLFEEGEEHRQIAHDALAQGIRDCMIPYGNETEDWSQCHRLLSLAFGVSEGELLAAKLSDDLRVVQGNIDAGSNSEASVLVGRANAALENGDVVVARDLLRQALSVCKDPQYQEQIQGWLNDISNTGTSPAYQPASTSEGSWKTAVGWLIAIVVVGVFLSNSDSCDSGSTRSTRPRSGQTYTRPTQPVTTPSQRLPTRPVYTQPTLESQIDTGGARVKQLEGEISALDRQLESLTLQLTQYKSEIERMERQARLGGYVNEATYDATLESHNALVPQYNSVSGSRQAKYAVYEKELKSVNALISRFNRGER